MVSRSALGSSRSCCPRGWRPARVSPSAERELRRWVPPLALSLCVPAVCGALSTSVPASAAVLGVRPLSSPPLCAAAAAADSSYSATLQRYFKALIREASTENWRKYVFISVLFQSNLIESSLFETCHRNNYRFIFCLKKSISCLPKKVSSNIKKCYCHICAKVSALLSPAVTFTRGHRCAQEHEACRKQDLTFNVV